MRSTLKIYFIIFIILFFIFISFTIINPKSNIALAIDPIVQYDSFIVLEIDNSSPLAKPIGPLEGVRNIQIKVKYFNTVPPIFKERQNNNFLNFSQWFLKGSFFGFTKFVFLVKVNLTIEDKPNWCSASIAPQYIIFEAFGNGSDIERIVTLQIAVNKSSTALFPFTLKVKAIGDSPDKHIKPPTNVSLPVSITPGYKSLISTDSGATIKKTIPGEPVNWNITISNYGNGEAIVRARVINKPPDWIINVNPQIIVPSIADGELNEKNMSLTALPPFNFGYYNEQVKIKIELTSESSSPITGNTANITKGDPIYLSYAIKLRGFSIPGFEFILLIFGILILIFIKKEYTFRGSNH